MVCELIELSYALYVSAYDGFFFFENANVSIDFDVGKLLVVEITECCWNLIFSFMVETAFITLSASPL